MTEARFAVATFLRVFDNTPTRDVISLEQLANGLCTFIVKGKAPSAIDRSERLLESTYRAFLAGEAKSGRFATALAAAADAARRAGGDVDAAVDAERQRLLADLRGDAKRDLRLWSPAYYGENAKRGSEHVIHLSCLVLDYDLGMPVGEAVGAWQEYFHIVHSTWSHTPEKPKFRIILPLAEPVSTGDWHRVYEWAQERTGMAVDPTGKSIGSTFALPTLKMADQPRIGFSQAGPLLDTRLEGLIEKAAPPPPEGIEPGEPNHFRIPLPGHEMVKGSWPEDESPRGGEWDAAFEW